VAEAWIVPEADQGALVTVVTAVPDRIPWLPEVVAVTEPADSTTGFKAEAILALAVSDVGVWV
jgi:hypothetical protein